MLKKIIMIAGLASLGFAGAANAADNGIYLNGQLGYGHTHYNGADNSSGGFAQRVAGGYQVTQNFAAELGYTHFKDTTFSPGKIQQYAIDLVAKGMLPLTGDFGVFGTLGGAYLNGKASISGESSNTNSNFWPTFGLGAKYDFTNSVPVTFSWQRIQKVGTSNLKSTDLFSLGLEYHFG
jgi:OOP family OmpA-OmpF porin